jgi:hypothetical protein
MTKNDIANGVKESYQKGMMDSQLIYESTNNAGGSVRENNRRLVEEYIVEFIFKSLITMHKLNGVVVTGKSNAKTITSENGEIQVSVDRHIHLPLIHFYVECKMYLETSMAKRACDDLSYFNDDNEITMIVSLENAMGEKAEKFFKDQGHVDKMIFLVDGKRSSTKPIWKKQFAKDLNMEKVMELIDYIESKLLN